MRTPLSAIALSIFVGAFVQAQDGVDFTGRWILETPSLTSAETPHALSVRQSLVTTNVRGEPMRPFFKDITIERQVGDGGPAETHLIGVVGGVVGGLTSTSDTAGSPREHHAVKWDANALVFESGRYTGQSRETGVWTERREIWSLDSDGRLHVVITTRGSGEALRIVSVRYRRQ
ncbi:MAG TPA: hypothetical protein VGF24_30590 [Vicinamibacterales bacterium]|jgi:uncharacterized DUF497 family protein